MPAKLTRRVSRCRKNRTEYVTKPRHVSTSTGKEVGSCEHVHVPADELLPSRRLPPFGSRCDVVSAQDVAHSLVGNRMTQVGQRADDAIVTPTGVLAGEANDQFLYLG